MRPILRALFSRGKFTVLAVAAALTLATTSTALGANGNNFILGVATNSATAITQLTANIAGPALKIVNTSTSAGATALNLRTASDKPPMTVNSGTKVTNLNADRLDSKDSTELAPILHAEQDADGPGQIVTGTTQVNSVSINAPVSGVVMISGTAYVNSYEPAAVDYILNPKVDGSNATLSGWGAYYSAPVGDPSGNGAPSSRFTLSYTVSEPVSAGSHMVSQELGQYLGGPVDFFHNNNELSVTFVPGSQASVLSAAPAAAAQSDGTTPTGQKR